MQKFVSITIALLVIACLNGCTSNPKIETSTCKQDLLYLHNYLQKNDAGIFQTHNARAADFLKQAVNTQLSNTAQLVGQNQCLDLMRNYVRHYRKGHLSINKGSSQNSSSAFIGSMIYNTLVSPSIEQLSNDTVLIDILSFSYYLKEKFEDIIEQNWQQLSTTPNWIIDLTHNTGGADDTFAFLQSLIVTSPIPLDGLEILVTPDNIEANKRSAIQFDGHHLISSQIQFMEQQPQYGFAMFKKPQLEVVKPLSAEFNKPKLVVLMIDKGCVSACEQFVLNVKESANVVVVGKNTAGIIDISNQVFQPLPSGMFELMYSISRSTRVTQGKSVDGVGIAPDIRLDFIDDIKAKKSNVSKVLKLLEQGKLTPIRRLDEENVKPTA